MNRGELEKQSLIVKNRLIGSSSTNEDSFVFLEIKLPFFLKIQKRKKLNLTSGLLLICIQANDE